MKIIHKILVPTDFSDCAINAYHFSLQLASKWNANIKLLHVVTPDYGVTDLPVLVDIATKEKIEVSSELLKNFRESGLANMLEMLPSLPVVTDELKVSSLPYAAIATTADENEVDLVVIGTNDYHSAWENAFGTNASSVLKQAHCNVLVVPELAPFHGFSAIGFAADLHETDPYHLWRFCKLMEPFHSVVHCTHIEKQGSSDKTQMRFEELQAFFENNNTALQLQFHALDEDSIETGLGVFIESYGLDLLAMPSPHRDAFSNMFHKSMTRQMALHSKVPLLVMK
ncbi:MAG: universal stress protein [Saprospiraceae bacterium]|nr:universal stress protein [Saprospiraceae bacterium]